MNPSKPQDQFLRQHSLFYAFEEYANTGELRLNLRYGQSNSAGEIGKRHPFHLLRRVHAELPKGRDASPCNREARSRPRNGHYGCHSSSGSTGVH
jgi:hypothetical protein